MHQHTLLKSLYTLVWIPSAVVITHWATSKMKKASSIRGGMPTPLQAAIVVTVLLASPAAVVLGIVTDEDCKCFMCVCDLDPHPQPPEVPTHHPTPVVPSPPPPSPSPPPPAPVVVPAYYPPPTGYGYYYPPQPYGYPWPTTTYGYGPPAGEMYPQDYGHASKSGAARRHGGGGRANLVLAVALASAVLSLLLRPAAA